MYLGPSDAKGRGRDFEENGNPMIASEISINGDHEAHEVMVHF